MSFPFLTEMYFKLATQKKSIDEDGVDSPYWDERKDILENYEKVKNKYFSLLKHTPRNDPNYEEKMQIVEEHKNGKN